jgi:probable rRNA maturation factor
MRNARRHRRAFSYTSDMLTLSIKNQQEVVELDFQGLKAAAKAVLEGEGISSAKVAFAFFDSDAIQALNKRHLNHDEPTDVLTFPYTAPDAKKLEGDIAIGAGVAKTAAEERGHPVHAELCLYVIHGCLHLCGYNDKLPRDIAEMRRKEREYLKKLNLPDIV